MSEKEREAWQETWETEPAAREVDPDSLDQFWIQATDGRGHGDQVHFKMPPWVTGLAAEIVHSGAIDAYRTTYDLYRDGIVRWLIKLKKHLEKMKEFDALSKTVSTTIGFELAAAKRLEHEKRKIGFQQTIDQMTEVVTDLERLGAIEEARNIVRDLYLQALGIQNSAYWRSRYVSEIERRFKHLLED